MGGQFAVFTKSTFEYKLRGVIWKLKCRDITDVTNDLERNGLCINEYVYLIETPKTGVSILVYSTVDRLTGVTREKGSDAVRIIVTIKTPRGRFYKALGTHKRIKTLFQNIEKTLDKALKDTKLGKYDYTKHNFEQSAEFKQGIGV